MQKIRIGSKLIGLDHPVYLVADAGSNHDGKLSQAKKLIDIAVEAEADAIKFQSFTANGLVRKSSKELHSLLTKIELKIQWLGELSDYCKSNRIDFLSTPFDLEVCDILNNLNIPAYKIASSDIDYFPLLKKVASYKKPIILSTGMATLGDIEKAIQTFKEAENENIILLHCVSEYPPSFKDINLRSMLTLQSALNYPIGFSDHTLGIEISLAAVALGAVVIEKHFTLDKTLPGPDHPYALNPDELKSLVSGIQHVKDALGSNIKKPTSNEINIQREARRSIVASTSVPKGTTLLIEHIKCVRPAYGLSPIFLDEIIGRKARYDLEEDEFISFKNTDPSSN